MTSDDSNALRPDADSTVDRPAHGFGLFASVVPEPGRLGRLGRQWWVVAAVTAIAMLCGAVYLTSATPQYTSSSAMLIEPAATPLLGEPTAAVPMSTVGSHFLATQCKVIASTPVLALAVPQMGALDALSGVGRPIALLKSHLAVTVGPNDDVVHVSASATNPADATRMVSAVVDAYRAYQSNQWADSAKQVLSILDAGRDAHAKERAEKTRALAELNRTSGPDMVDPAAAASQVRSLTDALATAHLETTRAHDAYDSASRAIIGKPALLDAVAEHEQRTGSVGDPRAELSQLQSELAAQQAKLADASRQYLPNHPIIKAISQRIEQLTVATVAVAEQWWDDAQAREQELRQSLAAARALDVAQQAKAADYARVSADVDRLKKSDELLDSRMKQIDLVRGAGAMSIGVLQPAEVVGPPSPQPLPTLGIAAGAGVLAGLMVALIRDGRDDRLRSPLEVQTSLQLPVIASVPAIAGIRTAADRGQLVHHDPFCPASESYRTLQTALQYGLPAGTRTMLVTSPATGDGKSTLLCNLAIAMAQAGRRVLIVDADFRAPTQHRLLGARDRVGLTSVIGGHATLDEAIERTGIERVSLLACGPVPGNPAETLNDPALSELFTELADRYDFILVDAPPVLAVSDARVLATLTDSTLLVLRGSQSTRRQAVQSRDALRSVGAKVVGVAINGVVDPSFNTTPGYTARPSAAAEPTSGPGHPSGRQLALAAKALKSGPRRRHRL